MTENEIAKVVVDASYHIHTRLGPGLLESVYVRILEYELIKRGLHVRREVPVRFRYDELEFDEGFRADIIVEVIVILELKAVEPSVLVHNNDLMTYKKVSQIDVELLSNSAPLINNDIFRLVNRLLIILALRLCVLARDSDRILRKK